MRRNIADVALCNTVRANVSNSVHPTVLLVQMGNLLDPNLRPMMHATRYTQHAARQHASTPGGKLVTLAACATSKARFPPFACRLRPTFEYQTIRPSMALS